MQCRALTAQQFFAGVVISRRIARVSILKESLLALSLLVVGPIAEAQQNPPLVIPPVDRAKLPPNLRNVTLHRFSSGALMLLNHDANLMLPPRRSKTTKAE